MAVFAVLTFVLKSHGKTEFVSRTHSRSLHAYASICLLAYSWLSHPEVHLFFYMQRQCKRVRCQTCLSISQRGQPAFARSAKVRFFLRIIANCCQLNALRLYILSSKREKVFKLQVDIAGKKKNYGKAISSFPFF